LIHRLVHHAKFIEITSPRLLQLREEFSNESYQMYITLDPLLLNGDPDQLYNHNSETYERLKSEEIRTTRRITSLEMFRSFYSRYLDIIESKVVEHFDRHQGMDIVLEEIFKLNVSVGMKCIQMIMNEGNLAGFIPRRPFIYLAELDSNNDFLSLYNSVLSSNFPKRFFWLDNYFRSFPGNWITSIDADQLVNIFSNLDEDATVWDITYWTKFLTIEPTVISRIMENILNVNEQEEFRIYILSYTFIDLVPHLDNNLELLKRSYLQQQPMKDVFDHNFAIFKILLKRDRLFLSEYINSHLKPGSVLGNQEGICIFWTLPNAEILAKNAFNQLLEDDRYLVTIDFIFSLIGGKYHNPDEKPLSFLKEYVEEYYTDGIKVNAVLKCINRFYKDQLKDVLHRFLSLNSDLSVFKSIHWTDDSYTGTRGTIFADIKKAEYQKILDIVNAIPMKAYLYADHVAHLKSLIKQADAHSRRERMGQFKWGV
jgi:hypothetical protein